MNSENPLNQIPRCHVNLQRTPGMITLIKMKVSAKGVSAAGIWTSLRASRRVTLRVCSATTGHDLNGGPAAEGGGDNKGGSSSVDMGDWGVRVRVTLLASSTFPPDSDVSRPSIRAYLSLCRPGFISKTPVSRGKVESRTNTIKAKGTIAWGWTLPYPEPSAFGEHL